MFSEYRAYKIWQAVLGDGEGAHTYGMSRGYDEYVGRDGEVEHTKAGVEADCRAAYKNAVRWMLSGDKRHAQKAFLILDTYAQNLRGFKDSGMGDRMLMVGLQGFTYAAAAEIIRRGHNVADGQDSGLIPEQFKNIDASIRNVWADTIEKSYIALPRWRAGNQGAMIITAYMAMAIYLDDQEMYRKALELLMFADNDGNMRNYVHHLTGQLSESTRDQPHALMGCAKIILGCEMAWKQGDNAYDLYDNVMYKSSEFNARYNLGDNNFDSYVPRPFDPRSSTYYYDIQWELSLWSKEMNSSGRGGGSIFPFELAYNHYVRRMGMDMPWTESMLPLDGEGWNASDAAPGYSSFLIAAPELVRELGL
jgi:hypothetical protein